jgi:hypothetical protein
MQFELDMAFEKTMMHFREAFLVLFHVKQLETPVLQVSRETFGPTLINQAISLARFS